MWRKICTKEFWANIFAYVLLLAVASAIVHSTFRSWEKDQEMRGYLVQAEELAQELLVSGCEFGLELRLQLEQVWLDRPSSPFDEQMQIGIVLCQGNDELKPRLTFISRTKRFSKMD